MEPEIYLEYSEYLIGKGKGNTKDWKFQICFTGSVQSASPNETNSTADSTKLKIKISVAENNVTKYYRNGSPSSKNRSFS